MSILGFYDSSSDSSETPDGTNRLRFIAFGSATILLGLLAFGHLGMASIVSTFIIGAIMLIGGALQIAHAISVRAIDKAHIWSLSGLFYLLSGAAMLLEPLFGSRLPTLVLAFSLAVSGVGRLLIGARLAGNWLLISGIASIMAGTVIGMEWPLIPLWMMAYVIAIDLLVQGVALVATGLQFSAHRS